jgi:methylthioribose-1-phosphate isomerase
MLPTIARESDAVVMIDQRKLPAVEVYVRCRTAVEVARAIKTMVIRGAPAIGVAAAMGIALGMRKSKATGTQKFAAEFQKTCDLMAGTRPTAVNLFWAIERMKRVFASAAQSGQSVEQIQDILDLEAQAIHDEDLASCRAMGAFGADVVPGDARILTHCNAGALATAGYGTALGVIRGAVEQGKRVSVFADETRPFLQGARLTCVGTGSRRHSNHHHHRQHGRRVDGAAQSRSRRRRRRPDCRQRRHREQNRHVRRRRARRTSTTSRFMSPLRCRRSI